MKYIFIAAIITWLTVLTITAANAKSDAKSKAMEYCITATGGALGSEQACKKEIYGK